MEAVGISEKYFEKSPFELSGGQKRRVAIAGVLAMNPEYLILDEPTAGLDPRGKKRILDLIKWLHEERNMTIILVSHSMEDVADYAKRLLVMNNGKLVFDGTPTEIFGKKEELEAIDLSAPETTYLMDMLHKKGFDVDRSAITMEQAKRSILDVLSNKKQRKEIIKAGTEQELNVEDNLAKKEEQ